MSILVLLLALFLPIRHGDRGEKLVALTFDACPTRLEPGYDAAIVKALLDSGVDATMFLSGSWVRKHEEQAVELARHFEIASHGYTHTHYDEQTPEWILADLAKAQRRIVEVTGKRPRFFRPPAIKWDEVTIEQARKLGLRTVTYDVASGDPDPNLKADAIVRYVLWKTKPGSVLIFHVNGKGWTTAATLPEIIAGLRRRGYRFVTVSELLVWSKALHATPPQG
jgi:peptidoglycan/xylan/chitin deacetylase (PgdA/CDA1 family)